MSDLTKARIVIADDDKENAKIVEQGLKMDGYQTKVVDDGEAVIHLIRSWTPHMLVLDVNMPKLSGVEVLKKVRALGGEYIAVLLLTANSDLNQIIEGLDSGADDYIIKPYRIEELRARVRNVLRMKSVQDNLKRAQKRLDDHAVFDELTGLMNMRIGLKKFQEELDKSKKNVAPMSCIIFDIDQFQEVNSKYDHAFGSQVLREVAQLFKPLLRPGDLFVRYGGDEFMIVLPNANVVQASEVSERLRQSLAAAAFKNVQNQIKITGSFGVAGIRNSDDFMMLEVRDMIRAANQALASAKANGKNKTEDFQIFG